MDVNDVVTLHEPLPDQGLSEGSVGTIVDVHRRPSLAYEVEFCDSDGATIALVTLGPHQIDMAGEIALAPPTRAEVRQVLRDLIDGQRSRDDADAWAMRWVGAPDPDVDDEAVWSALTNLAGCDTTTSPGTYLYGDADFLHWLEEFDTADHHELAAEQGVRDFVAALSMIETEVLSHIRHAGSVPDLIALANDRAVPRGQVLPSGLEYFVHGRGCRFTTPAGTDVDVDVDQDENLVFDAWRLRDFMQSSGVSTVPSTQQINRACLRLVWWGELRQPSPRWFTPGPAHQKAR